MTGLMCYVYFVYSFISLFVYNYVYWFTQEHDEPILKHLLDIKLRLIPATVGDCFLNWINVLSTIKLRNVFYFQEATVFTLLVCIF